MAGLVVNDTCNVVWRFSFLGGSQVLCALSNFVSSAIQAYSRHRCGHHRMTTVISPINHSSTAFRQRNPCISYPGQCARKKETTYNAFLQRWLDFSGISPKARQNAGHIILVVARNVGIVQNQLLDSNLALSIYYHQPIHRADRCICQSLQIDTF